jgi:hypothetical protein
VLFFLFIKLAKSWLAIQIFYSFVIKVMQAIFIFINFGSHSLDLRPSISSIFVPLKIKLKFVRKLLFVHLPHFIMPYFSEFD